MTVLEKLAAIFGPPREEEPQAVAGPPEDLGYAELHGGGSRVVVVPALGGKITAMELAGRQWLWTNDQVPARTPTDDESYLLRGDSGGFDECFPTIVACQLPSWIGKQGRTALPDHGELWSQQTPVSVVTAPEGHRITTWWTGRRLPYRMRREITVTPAGEVVMRYELANEGTERLPFLWAAQPLLPLTPTTRIDVPTGTRVRVVSEYNIALGGEGTTHYWPQMAEIGGGVDLSRPGALNRRFACKLAFEMTAGVVAVEEEGARLEVHFDPAEVPNFGLWINHRGWAPSKRMRAYENLAVTPQIGLPDSLSEALGKWESARWLEIGETRLWTLTWRGTVPVPPPPAGADAAGASGA